MGGYYGPLIEDTIYSVSDGKFGGWNVRCEVCFVAVGMAWDRGRQGASRCKTGRR